MTKRNEGDAFRIIDIVVLVGVTALGLAAIRAYSKVPDWIMPFPNTFYVTASPSLGELLRRGVFLLRAVSALLIAWSPAVLWCAWRRGRQGFGTMVERPGLLACAVAILVLPWYFVVPTTFEISVSRGALSQFPELPAGLFIGRCLDFLTRKAGVCVMIAWFALAASRKWRKPVGWVEWAGLVVGVGWIATWLTYLTFP